MKELFIYWIWYSSIIQDARRNKRVTSLFDIYVIGASFKMQVATKVISLYHIYDIVGSFKIQDAIKELFIYSKYMIK